MPRPSRAPPGSSSPSARPRRRSPAPRLRRGRCHRAASAPSRAQGVRSACRAARTPRGLRARRARSSRLSFSAVAIAAGITLGDTNSSAAYGFRERPPSTKSVDPVTNSAADEIDHRARDVLRARRSGRAASRRRAAPPGPARRRPGRGAIPQTRISGASARAKSGSASPAPPWRRSEGPNDGQGL